MKKLFLTLLLTITYLLPPPLAAAENSADFSTMNGGTANTTYGTYKSTAGWTAVNSQLVKINGTVAPTLNGKTSAVGTLTSPDLSGGLGTISFKYQNTYSENNGVSLQISVKSGGTTYTDKITNSSVTQSTEYSYTTKEFNIEGAFTIEIKNLSPSNNTGNKDRVSIYDLTWTSYSKPSGPVEYDFEVPTTMEVGESYTLQLGDKYPESFEIISATDAVATVTESAPYVIKALTVGSAEFTAMWDGDENFTAGEKDFTITVTKVLKEVTSFSYSSTTATYDLAGPSQLPTLTVDPAGLEVSYTSSEPTVATVSGEGVVTPLAVGKTVITATFAGDTEYKAAEASYTLTVTDSQAPVEPDGSKDNPYTAAQVVAGGITASGKVWVEGYIIGTMVNNSLSTSLSNAVNTNLVIASSPTETSKYAPVELPSGNIRTALNLKDNPENLGRRVKLYGNLQSYFSKNGVKGVSEYEFYEEAEAVAPTKITFTPDGGDILTTDGITIEADGSAPVITYTIDSDNTVQTYNGNAIFFDTEGSHTIYATASNDAGTITAQATYNVSAPSAPENSKTYKLINSVKDIKENGKYILVAQYNNGYVAMSSTNESNKFKTATVFNENGDIKADDSGLLVLSPENISVSDDGFKCSWKSGAQYLYSASSTNLSLSNNKQESSVTIEDNIVKISLTDGRFIFINTANDKVVFGNYSTSNANQSGYILASLYREVDEEYVEAPEALYLFGDFGTYSSWDLTKGVEVKPLYEGSSVYSAEAMFIGTVDDEGNPDEGGYFVMATAQAPKSEIATAAIPQSVDWASLGDARVIYPNEHGENALEGMTFNSMPASEVEQSSLNMYYVAEPGLYNITVDFSGYTPEVSQFAKSNETQTGIENVAAGNVAEVEYYNLQGVRVLNPSAGIYIRRQGSSVSKIMVK